MSPPGFPDSEWLLPENALEWDLKTLRLMTLWEYARESGSLRRLLSEAWRFCENALVDDSIQGVMDFLYSFSGECLDTDCVLLPNIAARLRGETTAKDLFETIRRIQESAPDFDWRFLVSYEFPEAAWVNANRIWPTHELMRPDHSYSGRHSPASMQRRVDVRCVLCSFDTASIPEALCLKAAANIFSGAVPAQNVTNMEDGCVEAHAFIIRRDQLNPSTVNELAKEITEAVRILSGSGIVRGTSSKLWHFTGRVSFGSHLFEFDAESVQKLRENIGYMSNEVEGWVGIFAATDLLRGTRAANTFLTTRWELTSLLESLTSTTEGTRRAQPPRSTVFQFDTAACLNALRCLGALRASRNLTWSQVFNRWETERMDLRKRGVAMGVSNLDAWMKRQLGFQPLYEKWDRFIALADRASAVFKQLFPGVTEKRPMTALVPAKK